MQSTDVTINGTTYTIEAWNSEVHGFYPMVHTQDGHSVNIGADEDAYCATPEEAIELGVQALRALNTAPGYAVGYGVDETAD